jgi:16S rRNA (cytosine1402-N4)-methyltransferase
MLQKLQNGRIFAFDQDKDAAGNIFKDDRLFFIRHNFRYIKNFLRYYNVKQADSIFADLGVSSHDFDVPERGFSFRHDARLDMRMNRDAKTDATSLINTYSEEQLITVFRLFGEINNAKRLASEISGYRTKQPIKSTAEFKEIAAKCAPKGSENKYLAQVFQAVRIEVNDEMEALKEFFLATLDVLKKGGRLVVITYHSLEDRMCKNFMRTGNFEGKLAKDFYGIPVTPFKMVNRKVIIPGELELINNSRARSAKLRIAERI